MKKKDQKSKKARGSVLAEVLNQAAVAKFTLNDKTQVLVMPLLDEDENLPLILDPSNVSEPDTESIESFALVQAKNPNYVEYIRDGGFVDNLRIVSRLIDVDGTLAENGQEALLKAVKAKTVVVRRKDETRSAFKRRAVKELRKERNKRRSSVDG